MTLVNKPTEAFWRHFRPRLCMLTRLSVQLSLVNILGTTSYYGYNMWRTRTTLRPLASADQLVQNRVGMPVGTRAAARGLAGGGHGGRL